MYHFYCYVTNQWSSIIKDLFPLNVVPLWLSFMVTSMRKVEPVPWVSVHSHSQQLSVDLLCSPWRFVKSRPTAIEADAMGNHPQQQPWCEWKARGAATGKGFLRRKPWRWSGAASQWAVTAVKGSYSLSPLWSETFVKIPGVRLSVESFVHLWPGHLEAGPSWADLGSKPEGGTGQDPVFGQLPSQASKLSLESVHSRQALCDFHFQVYTVGLRIRFYEVFSVWMTGFLENQRQ